MHSYHNVRRAAEMTPNQARDPKSQTQVAWNNIKHAPFARRYPEDSVGDTGRIFRKKRNMEKQQKSVWLPGRCTAQEIRNANGQNFYATS